MIRVFTNDKTYQLPFLFLDVYSLRLLTYKYLLLRPTNPSPQSHLGEDHVTLGSWWALRADPFPFPPAWYSLLCSTVEISET